MGMADVRTPQEIKEQKENDRKTLIAYIEILQAVEKLEYHDKNFLPTNRKGLSEDKQAVLYHMLEIARRI